MEVKTVKIETLNVGDVFIIPQTEDAKDDNTKYQLFVKTGYYLKDDDSSSTQTWVVKVGHMDSPVNKFLVSSDKDVVPITFH